MKLIHINESVFNRLMEAREYIPFERFYGDVIDFIQKLRKDPIGAKPSDELKSRGLDNGTLRNLLIDKNIITKKEDVREPYDEVTKKKTSRYYISYKVIEVETLKDKLRKLHNELFDGTT